MKKINKLLIKQAIALIPTIGLIVGFTLTLYNIVPPLGNLLQPINGIYQTLDDGQFPDRMIVQDRTLIDEVNVIRDEYGVPHIYASTIDDLFFAEGYIMAYDRLFEMDVLRRVSSGRLAELIPMINLPNEEENLDPDTIAAIDAYIRYIGLDTVGENLIKDVVDMGPNSVEFRAVSRYTDGVNLAIQKMIEEKDLPLSYILLNTQPELWNFNDTGYVYALITFAMGLKSKDLDHTAMAETLGVYINENKEKYRDEGFNVIFPETNGSLPYENPVIPNNESIFPQSSSSDPTVLSAQLDIDDTEKEARLNSINFLIKMDEFLHKLLGLPFKDGSVDASNNWVISGNRSLSGKPIVANDPHLLIMQPSVFYEVHLVCNNTEITNPKGYRENMNVHGVTMPGEPFIVIGFNDNVSWGITNFASDSLVDYYYETINEDGTQYFYNGSWHDLEIVHEKIHVRRGNDLEFTIRKTIHGPIITDAGSMGALSALFDTANPDEAGTNKAKVPVSMCWVALKEIPNGKNMFSSVYRLMTAAGLSDFQEAMDLWSVPAMNVVYGDIHGNIALYVPGLHPIRGINGTYKEEYTGSFIQPGDGSGQEWIGWIPNDQVPHSINPEQGYLTSANQRTISARNYNYSVGRDWTSGNYRARRINEVLNNTIKGTIEDMARLQADIVDVFNRNTLPYLLDSLSTLNLVGDYKEAYNELIEWNNTYPGEMRRELIAPTIYNQFVQILEKNVWDDEWKASNATGHYPNPQYLEYMIREKQDSVWFDNVETEQIETSTVVLRKSFFETVDYCSKNLGNLTTNKTNWIYGKNLKLLMLSSFRMIDLALKQDTGFPYEGSEFTVDVAVSFGEFPSYVYGGPAWRHIIDFGDPKHPWTVIPPGNSANMFSGHWEDQLELFINNQYKIPCRAGSIEEFVGIKIESIVIFEAKK